MLRKVTEGMSDVPNTWSDGGSVLGRLSGTEIAGAGIYSESCEEEGMLGIPVLGAVLTCRP